MALLQQLQQQLQLRQGELLQPLPLPLLNLRQVQRLLPVLQHLGDDEVREF
jgi:hypothetical protein